LSNNVKCTLKVKPVCKKLGFRFLEEE